MLSSSAMTNDYGAPTPPDAKIIIPFAVTLSLSKALHAMKSARSILLLCASVILLLPVCLTAQSRRGEDIAQAKRALNSVYSAVKLGYYDPSFHGLNMDSLYDVAKADLDRAETAQQRYRAISRMLEALDDSHTGFIVAWRIGLWDYHIGFHFYGDLPLINRVDPGSVADSVGVRRGDEIVSFAGQRLTRENYWKVIEDFMAADTILPLKLRVRGVDGALSTLTLTADTLELRKMRGANFRKLYAQSRDSAQFATSHVQVSVADSVFIWRLPQFADIDKGLNDVVKRARAHRVLIMDLRGNPGGSIETLSKVLGYFVDEPLVVGDLHLRTSKDKFIAKPNKQHIGARTFILVDSETGSSAEVFTRILQLLGKATVIGDRTAGAVMASQYFPADDDMGAYITVSDFVLFNGERLEKRGVTPDIMAVELPCHVAAGGDPVLSLALLRAGVRMPPAMARQIMAKHN